MNDVGATLNVMNSRITGNTANRAGGGIEGNSTGGTNLITLNDVLLNSNIALSAPGNGGGVHMTGPGTINITGGTVNTNSAGREGGGLWNDAGTMTVSGTIIDGNTASGPLADDGGGGIFNNGGTLNVTGAILKNNKATGTSGSGGGLFSTDGTVTITQSIFDLNAANRAGGAIEVINGTLNSSAVNYTKNDVDGTAGVANPGNGGAIHITGAVTSTFTGGMFVANAAAREGGALWNQTASTMNINGVAIDSNLAKGNGAAFGGGGVFVNGGSVIITQSSITNNQSVGATGNGGWIHVKTGSASLMTSTLSDNSSVANGGGIYNNATLNLNAVTVANNQTILNGGGIENVSAIAPTLKNSIIASNTGLIPDLSTSSAIYSSNGYNLIGIATGGTITGSTGDMIGTIISPVNPMLVALGNNGGTTLTHSLMAGSPARNAGDGADIFVDQRGMAVFMGVRDIGSYESQSPQGPIASNKTILQGDTETTVSEIVQKEIEILIYPNPVIGGKFAISSTSFIENNMTGQLIEISTGKIVQSFELNQAINNLSIDNVTPGMYIIKMNDATTSYIQKLIIK